MPAYEWDPAKNLLNQTKHGVPFEIAPLILEKPHYLKVSEQSHTEERWIAVGIYQDVLFAVVYTIRNQKYRIISIRRARHSERQAYDALHQ